MTSQEFIEYLPFSDKYKTPLIDVGIWIGAIVTSQYEQTFMSILLTFLGVLILAFRGVKAFFDMKKSIYETETARLNSENIKEGYKTELKVSKPIENIKKSM